MTTNHHTAHAFGAALTSAEVNRPLGELDSAIASVIATGSGASTTLTAQALAGQANLTVASVTGFVAGDTIWIGDSGGTFESRVILSIAGSVITCTTNLANTYAIGKPVSKSPIELVDARGNQATAGARIKLIEERVFDVKRYGAKGDGVTDDRAAIQAALDAAAAAGGGTVLLPHGNFVIASGLALPSGGTVAGSGWGSTITANGNYAAITSTTTTKVAVRDLRIVGSANAANTNNRGVQFTGTTHGLISGLRTEGCYRGVALVSPCAYVVIQNCVVDNDKSNVGAIDLSGVEKCAVISCTVTSPATHGIDIREATASAYGYNRVIGCHVQSAGTAGIVISGSSVAGITLPGCEVIGCTVVGAAQGIIVENGAFWTRVASNMLRDITGAGILVSKGTGDAPNGTVVEGNTLRNVGSAGGGTGHGIQSFDSNYTVIASNRIQVFVDDGIRINGGSVLGAHSISGNSISDGTATTGAAIRVYGNADNTTIVGNAIKNTAGYGIRIEGSICCAVSGNTVIDADNTGVLTIGGISVDATAHRTAIVGNTSRRSAGTKQDHGVQITAGATNCAIVANSLFQNTTSAILDGGTGTISANNITT